MSHHRRPITSVIATLLTAGLLVLAPVLAQGAAAAPASVGADPAPVTGCAQLASGYAPRSACQLVIQRAESACVGGAPVLEYAVEPEGTPNTTVSITWQNPSGADIVDAGLPLSGSVLWPGTVIEDGRVVDWPGWTAHADGTFTQGDEYDWLRSPVTLLFKVNPSATAVVVYPPESASCSNPLTILSQNGGVDPALPTTPVITQPTFRSGVLAAEDPSSAGSPSRIEVTTATGQAGHAAFRSGVLAATGIEVGPELQAAGLLLAAGCVLLSAVRVIGRRRNRTMA